MILRILCQVLKKNEFCSQKSFAHWFPCIPLEVIEKTLVLRARFFRQVLEAGQVCNSKVAEKHTVIYSILLFSLRCAKCTAACVLLLKINHLLIMCICIPQKLCMQGKL